MSSQSRARRRMRLSPYRRRGNNRPLLRLGESLSRGLTGPSGRELTHAVSPLPMQPMARKSRPPAAKANTLPAAKAIALLAAKASALPAAKVSARPVPTAPAEVASRGRAHHRGYSAAAEGAGSAQTGTSNAVIDNALGSAMRVSTGSTGTVGD